MQPEHMHMIYTLVPLLLAGGAAGGFLSGLLGIGGGVIFVPALYFTLSAIMGAEHAMHVTVGSSLAIVVVTTLMSSRGHYRRGAVDMNILKNWGPFITVGGLTGSLLAGQVDGGVLKAVFAVLTLLIAVYMASGKRVEEADHPAWMTAPIQRLLCFAMGGGSAMAGLGGGALTVPLMLYAGKPVARAVGTGSALGVLVAVPGVVTYIYTGWTYRDVLPPLSLGFVNPVAAALVLAGAAPMVRLGVRTAHRIDKVLLRRVFAVVLVAVSAKMFLSL